MSETDLELLARYTRDRAEDSFAEIVRRHLALVYSAALRQVRSPQLAEEVAQCAFLKLARHAHQLAPNTILSAWLYQVTRREAIDVVRREASRQLRERIAMEMNTINATAADWTHIEPLLDEAMHALDETDRAAVLLRYFENKSLREVGQALGATENAAQKRLSRAVESLRDFFAKRGLTVGASGLVVVISANAVQAAPVGLALTLTTATAFAGTTVAATATATTKAIAMTTLQKTFIAVALAATAGTGIYKAHQASTLRRHVQMLQQQQDSFTEQIQQLTQARDEANSKLAAQASDSEQLNRATAEIVRLRNEVNLLRGNRGGPPQAADAPSLPSNDETIASKAQEDIAAGRELGMAVVRGDAGAFERMWELAKNRQTSFKTNSLGLTDTQRGDLARLTFAPLTAAFQVIAEAATAGNSRALDAVVQSAQIAELKGQAIQTIGKLAGRGDPVALETLLNPEKYGFLLSSVVGALKPAAENGNQQAIDALAAVAGSVRHQPLWYMAADGLSKAAESGNAVAIDALIGLMGSTNRSAQKAAVPALQRAAANQNAKAAEALRSLRTQ